jgi:hypothetical protein
MAKEFGGFCAIISLLGCRQPGTTLYAYFWFSAKNHKLATITRWQPGTTLCLFFVFGKES